MLVNKFDGGLSTRQEPQLIGTNEAAEFTNIDNASGVLKPVPGPTTVDLAVNSYPFWYEEGNRWIFASGEYLPRAKLAGKVYEASATDIMKVYNETSDRFVGVTKPPAAPGVVYQGAPGRIASAKLSPTPSANSTYLPRTSHTYLLLNRNASGYSLGLSTTVRPTGLSSVLSSNYYWYRNERIGIEDYEAIVEQQNSNYQTVTVGPVNALISSSYGVDVFRVYNGVHRLVGTLTSNTDTLVDNVYDISANAELDGDNFSQLLGKYQYAVTRINSEGIESQPSAVSDLVDLSTGGNVAMTFASYSAPGGKIRIYRVGGTLTSFTLVEEIAGTSVNYLDNIADTAVEGTILSSQDNAVPTGPMTSLISAYAMLFGAVGSTLVYTDPGAPEYWPAEYSIPFPSTISGLAAVANGILVMTRVETYLVSGTGPLVLSVQLLSGDQGCIDPKSVQVHKANAIWASHNGLAMSSGSGIDVITKSKLGYLDLSPIRSSVMHDEVYYVSSADPSPGTAPILAVDFRYGGAVFKSFDFITIGSYVTFFRDNTTLYYSSGAFKYIPFSNTDNPETLYYTSPRFIEGKASENKTYKKFYFYVEGEMRIDIMIDDEVVATKTTTPGTKDAIVLQVPQSKQRGFFVQFQFIGTGTIYEYEYKAASRQND